MSVDVSTLVARYIDERKAAGLGAATATKQRYTLEGFAGCCRPTPTAAAIRRWLAAQQHLAASTRRTRISTLRGFLRWLHTRRHTPTDLSGLLARPPLPRRVPRALQPDQVAALYRVCHDTRSAAIVALMVEAGLRRAEVARLEVGDWDRRAGLLFVVGKGGHQRMVPLTAAAHLRLSAYLDECPATHGPLIRSRWDRHAAVVPDTIGRLMSRLLREAGVKRASWDGVSGHALRHTAASDTLEVCGDLRVVQEFLGHAHLQTTSIYLRRAGLGRLREAMAARPTYH